MFDFTIVNYKKYKVDMAVYTKVLVDMLTNEVPICEVEGYVKTIKKELDKVLEKKVEIPEIGRRD